MNTARIICGDVREVLPTLAAESVQCVVTSPPYWGLRDYGHERQIGLERTPQEYVAKMVAVFREVRLVLRPDGVLWLNLGDSYATGAGAVGDCPGGGAQGGRWVGDRGGREGKHAYVSGAGPKAFATNTVDPKARRGLGPMTQPNRLPQPGLKPKDLVGIPWRVAFALQEDGWYLRSDCIWAKPNPMPESVTDRPTKAHEYLFLLTKSERYFYDAEAIQEPLADASAARYDYAFGGAEADALLDANKDGIGRRTTPIGMRDVTAGRNKRTVWTIATQPYADAHFAVMPEALVEPCILAGSREGDTVLDPFAGSGTVGVVALKNGRGFLGIELNPTYAQMARDRIHDDAPLLNQSEVRAV